MTIEQVLAYEEYQIFDRKSIIITVTFLSDTICAFANADGGTIAIGITDKTKQIEGDDGYTSNSSAPKLWSTPSRTVIIIETKHIIIWGKPGALGIFIYDTSYRQYDTHHGNSDSSWQPYTVCFSLGLRVES